ncbi:spermidine synthase [Paenibacillus sp. MBLB4367]|uniref:spermidine synthase n=1 Tax=Paenibacillus sp. MBLB4367 TaxID=3384767 RepID=UPI0039080D4B
MFDIVFWMWFAAGVLSALTAEGAVWLYWRYLGAGSIRDYISKHEEPSGAYKVVAKYKTLNQKVALVEQDGYYHVFADGSEMFSTTEDDDKFAEAIVHVPAAVAEFRERMLIIGAGGGITTREALRYPEATEIVSIDVDPAIMNMGKTLEPLVKFNKGSLNNPKVRTLIKDGRAFVEQSNETWDVIVIDLPDPSRAYPELRRLFSVEFYKLLKTRLEPGGAIAIACSAASEMPGYFRAIQATLKAAGFHVIPYHYDFIVELGVDWGFCLATLRPVSRHEIRMKLPTKYLSRRRLDDMFRLPIYFKVRWDDRNIQTDENHLLADIVEKAGD